MESQKDDTYDKESANATLGIWHIPIWLRNIDTNADDAGINVVMRMTAKTNLRMAYRYALSTWEQLVLLKLHFIRERLKDNEVRIAQLRIASKKKVKENTKEYLLRSGINPKDHVTAPGYSEMLESSTTHIFELRKEF